MATRRFEYVGGASAKFWEIEVRGASVTTRWGRLGTTGQTKVAKLASPAAAVAAAEKQIREKTAKGYAEAGARAAYDDMDARYACGWPHLRRLVDAPEPKNVLAAVREELDAVDPVFGVDVHREVATRFLHAMTVDRRDAAARAEAIARTSPIDDGVLRAILERLCPALVKEIYAFRIHDATWLLEAFLGAEHVAEAMVEQFVKATNRKLWTQLDNAHDHAFHFAHAFAFLRLRMPAARWKKIIAPLAAVKPSSLLFTERLALIADPKRAVPQKTEAMRMITFDVLIERDDPEPLRAYVAKWGPQWRTPRLLHVAGAELMDDWKMDGLTRLPAWWQERIVAEFGTIRSRGVVRAMMWLLSGRSAKQEAAAWLRAHADFARPVLDEISGDEAKLAATAREVIGGTAPVTNKKLTQAQVSKEVQAIMAKLERQLLAAGPDGEADVLRAAFGRYCETRAAGGDVMPEAYFTHHMADIDWKSDAETTQRWFDVAIEVID